MLFFAVSIGYIVPVHHLIIHRSLLALDQLRRCIDPPGEVAIDGWRRRLTCKSRRWTGLVLGGSTLAGTAHNVLLVSAEELELAGSDLSTMLPILTTTLIWVVMATAISSLIDNALLFRRLALKVRIDPLNVRALTPFGAVAVSSTLALVGAQASFSLLTLGADTEYVTFVPGLIATGVPMVLLFLLPVLPLHRRILEAKRLEMDRISRDIESRQRSGVPDVDRYLALQPLLTYRREVGDAPEWPFDTSVMGRLALYLIIPPLTWVGAALIEILIDSAF